MPDDRLSTTETNSKRSPLARIWDDLRSVAAIWLLDRAIDVAPEREKAAVARGVIIAARGIMALDDVTE